MEDNTIYQTLEEYLFKPFGIADSDQDKILGPKYLQCKDKIKLKDYAVYDDDYYIHIVIPSESTEGKFYDVILQFFYPDDSVKTFGSLNKYFVQFFSTSPSFIYKYAALYKLHGYLIDVLQEKLDPDYADRLPDKTNKDYKMSYDKSLYFACRFLYENRFSYMMKAGLKLQKKVQLESMINSIVPVNMVKLDDPNTLQDIYRETKKDKEKAKNFIKNQKKNERTGKHIIPKKTGSTTTMKDNAPRGIIRKSKMTPVKKKSATRTTTKRR